MTFELESVVREFLKNIVQEVLIEHQKNICKMNQPPPQIKVPLKEEVLLLSSRDTAKRLAISERHLFNLTRSGKLPCVRIGQCVRYSLESIQRWISESESIELMQPRKQRSATRSTITENKNKSVQQHNPTARTQRNSGKNAASATHEKQRKNTRASIQEDSVKREAKEKLNPFSGLLNEIGVNRDDLPLLTYGDLRQIADVDMVTFHGWMYLKRELPETALQKLRDHFSAFRRSVPE